MAGKVVTVHTMKAYRESGGKAPPIINTVLDGVNGQLHTPYRFIPTVYEELQVLFIRVLTCAHRNSKNKAFNL
jgi:hypothetical protein